MGSLALLGGEPVRSAPWPEWPTYGSADEVEAVVRALKSNHLCGAAGGEAIPAFEAAFAAWCGAAGAVTCNSGSSSLQVALAAVGVGPGDEVIVPTYTYFSSGTSVLVQGAVPVFADIDRGTANIDPRSLAERITERTKAVMVVHANGIPAEMDAILAVCEPRGVRVVEDCSHAHGARYRGRRVGTLGDAGAFSIQHKKILSVGEGGVVVSRDPDVVERAHAFVNLGVGSRKGILGPNLRWGELHAALACVRLEAVDGENDRRRANADRLRERIADLPGLRAVPATAAPDTEPVYYNFTLDFDADAVGVGKRPFCEAVQAEGVPLRAGGYRPLNTYPVFAEKQAWPYRLAENAFALANGGLYGEGLCPVGEAFMAEGNLELKIHPPVGDAEIEDAVRAIRKVLEQAGSLKEAAA